MARFAKYGTVVLLTVVLVLSLVPATSAQEGESDLPPQAQFVSDSVVGGNLDEIETYIHPDFVWYANGEPFVEGLEGYEFAAGFWHGLFPDLEITVDDMVVAEDAFTWRGSMLGTHSGEIPDIPPTGNELSLPFVGLFKLEDGKIIEVWMMFSDINWQTTLGLLVLPEGAAE